MTGEEPGRSARDHPAGALITVSATYGAGGSVVAPALAGRLEVPFLQRVTTVSGGPREPTRAGERLSVHEKRITPVGRLIGSLTHAMPAGPTLSPPSTRGQHEELRRHIEAEIESLAASGRGVILGRAAAVVLGRDRGYHVRLNGPQAARAANGAAIEGVTVDEARAHLQAADKARTAYVRRLYGVDPADPSLYHLMIDSTAMPLEAVIELILSAWAAARAPATSAKARY